MGRHATATTVIGSVLVLTNSRFQGVELLGDHRMVARGLSLSRLLVLGDSRSVDDVAFRDGVLLGDKMGKSLL